MISIDPEKRNDLNQRYQMPEIQLQNQGKGCHGKTTVIKNSKKLAESLSIPEDILSKMFGKLLNTSYDSKSNGFAGNFNLEKIKKHLDFIINDIVLCPNCRCPELSIPTVEKKGKKDKNWSISYYCNGCGHKFSKLNNTFSTKIIIKYLENSKNNWDIKKGNSVQKDLTELNNLTFEI